MGAFCVNRTRSFILLHKSQIFPQGNATLYSVTVLTVLRKPYAARGLGYARCMNQTSITTYTLGIDIGSTTVKVALLDRDFHIVFSDYKRHYANIQETLADLLREARKQTGPAEILPVITGSGGLTLSSHLKVPFVQEVVAVASALQDYAPQTDVPLNWAERTPKSSISPEALTSA